MPDRDLPALDLIVQSRDARQDLALVALLEALPEDRLTRVLTGLGIEPERAAEAQRKRDLRRCKECGQNYVRCRALDERAPEGEKHEWQPDRNRMGEPL